MKLKEMLKLLQTCEFMVIDLDSGLRTEWIPSWEIGKENPQCRTLNDKTVKCLCPVSTSGAGGSLPRIQIEVAS